MACRVQVQLLLVCLLGLTFLARSTSGRGLDVGGSTQQQGPPKDDEDVIVVVSPLRPCDKVCHVRVNGACKRDYNCDPNEPLTAPKPAVIGPFVRHTLPDSFPSVNFNPTP